TNIARGAARMLGFHLVENFDRPYSALSTPEFWRKWHISLSSWVGDYVYTPLLRSGKPGPARTVMALMVTFLAIGLWHGASWNYVMVGVYNGLWMVFYTFAVPVIPQRLKGRLVFDFGAWLVHTVLVLQVTALLFRERNLERVWQHLTGPWLSPSPEEVTAAAMVFAFALAGTIPLNVSFWVQDKVLPRLRESTWGLPVQTAWWSLEGLALFVFARDASGDFIYFQF
ncbi:MAG: hypothetical protein KC656_26360, partial [Myxococcales bacterium]|nr:hypothetical protein [Myxococcales bacterium]